MRRDLGISMILAAAILLVYGQVERHDFINYDDPTYVVENPHVKDGLTWDGMVWAFTSTERANWHPLTWLSHMLDVQLFGLGAGAQHRTNVVLHAANSLLLYFVLRRMTAAPWRSAVVAALFAVHPLHVESVAWAAERKDVLSTLFWFLTLGAYAWYAARPQWKRYVPVAVFLMLGLMAKPMLVTAPLVLLLLDYWPLGRLRWGENVGRRVLEKAPLLGMAAASSLITVIAQHRGGAVVPTYVMPLDHRMANALVSYVAYVGKMLWPADLSVFYPYRVAIPTWQWAASAAVLAAICAAVVWAGRRRRYLPVGWFWYLGTLVPVIGLVQVGQQAMADRYTYVPLVGLFIAGVWGTVELVASRTLDEVSWSTRRGVLAAMAAAAVLVCMAGAWVQVGYWQNSLTLFQHALKVTTDNAVAHVRVGDALMDRSKGDEAVDHYLRAVRIDPHYAEAYNALGIALASQGKKDEAVAQYREALRIKPDLVEARTNLALAMAEKGCLDEAIAAYREALRCDPANAGAHYNLGLALIRQGRPDAVEDAVAHYREAMRLKPSDPAPFNNLAWIRATHPESRFRDGAEAVWLAEQAHTLAGYKDPSMLDTLAAAYAEAGRFSEAVAAAEAAAALAKSTGAKDLAAEIEKRLQLYKAGRPYREGLPQMDAAPSSAGAADAPKGL